MKIEINFEFDKEKLKNGRYLVFVKWSSPFDIFTVSDVTRQGDEVTLRLSSNSNGKVIVHIDDIIAFVRPGEITQQLMKIAETLE